MGKVDWSDVSGTTSCVFSPHVTWLHCMWNVGGDVGEV